MQEMLQANVAVPPSVTRRNTTDRKMVRALSVFDDEIRRARDAVEKRARELLLIHHDGPFDAATVPDIMAAGLAEVLGPIVSRTLVLELNVARLQGLLEGATPHDRFEHFVRRLRTPAVEQALRKEYPLMVEQVRTRLQVWVDYSIEFLSNLGSDWHSLRESFFESDPGKMTAVRFGAGDSHRGGRSVIVLQFASGEKLVYKPRSLAIDVHFNDLLGWLNDGVVQLPFRLLRILDRASHGWVEYVRREDCADTAAAKRFYERQGELLAVLYAFEATDFHRENLIAAGEHPVLIDLESLFQGRGTRPPTTDPTNEALSHSVLRTGLLPVQSWAGEQVHEVDTSGLGGAMGQIVPNGARRWQNPETDEMRLVIEPIEISGAENLPRCGGRELAAQDYAHDIDTGFARTYEALMRRRDPILTRLRQFADDEIRYIARPTQTYVYFLADARHPDWQNATADCGQLFDKLKGLDALRGAERSDLERGDVPWFGTRPNSRHVWTSTGERIENYLPDTGLSLVERRIRELNPQDLVRQRWFIRASLATLSTGAKDLPMSTALEAPVRTATVDELMAEACKIGNRLDDLAIRGDGAKAGTSWIGLALSAKDKLSVAPLGADLYDGLPGVVLFLAYLGAVSGTARYTALAKSALPVLRQMSSRDETLQSGGGYSGWGGLHYCFAHLAVLWQDEELRREAERMAELAAALIANDETLDIIGGVAGLALTLRSSPNDRSRAIARSCGDRLLATAIAQQRGVGWLAGKIAAVPLTGFAHGAAGIAHALLELSTFCDEPKFAEMARQAFEYERGHFDAAAGNWLDLRHPGTQVSACGWCHGAPGIGLSRLGALRHMPDDELLRDELRIALETTARAGVHGNHCACHGTLGNLDILVSASAALHDPTWLEKARRCAGGVLDTVGQTGWICGTGVGTEIPGLMTGIAGIGYQLLRLAYPDRLPSVLALEAPL